MSAVGGGGRGGGGVGREGEGREVVCIYAIAQGPGKNVIYRVLEFTAVAGVIVQEIFFANFLIELIFATSFPSCSSMQVYCHMCKFCLMRNV